MSSGSSLCTFCGSSIQCVHRQPESPTQVVPSSIPLNPEIVGAAETYLIGGIHKIWIHHSKRHFCEMEIQFFNDGWPKIRLQIPQAAFDRLKAEAEIQGLCRKEV